MTARSDLPEPLVQALRDATEALARDPRGALVRGRREAVWAALGARDDAGRRRRALLAAGAVAHVLPDWRRAFPHDDTPAALLALVRAVLDGADRAEAARALGRARTELDDLGHLHPHEAAVAVGYGAAQALAAALADETFDPASVRPDLVDDRIDPESHDGSYLASVARAGGPPWVRGTSADRRRAFWSWWLREAVPSAYAGAVALPGPADSLLDLVRRADGSAEAAEAIEGARDDVTPALLPALAAAYAELGWLQRGALVFLIQDHLDPCTTALMRDFLLGSPDDDPGEEAFAVARAIALCHVEQDLDRFEAYLDDPAAVEARRAALRSAP